MYTTGVLFALLLRGGVESVPEIISYSFEPIGSCDNFNFQISNFLAIFRHGDVWRNIRHYGSRSTMAQTNCWIIPSRDLGSVENQAFSYDVCAGYYPRVRFSPGH
jgi:hypothetical protein